VQLMDIDRLDQIITDTECKPALSIIIARFGR
jgi:hypothetical protein